MQVRAVLPPDQTAEVLAFLERQPSLGGLEVSAGASRLPAGDVVTADVAREGVNAVVDELRRRGVHHTGSIQVTDVPTWLSRTGRTAELRTPGSGADAVVWSQVVHEAYDEAELNWTFASFMVLATIIASIAIVTDSVILVIGAMVLGPEFATVAAMAVGLSTRRWGLLRRGLRSLVLGFLLAIGVAALLALLIRALGWASVADVTTKRDGTAFVYRPDKWSFIVAVVAGAAGVLSLTSSRVGGLTGVFISVTTVPAAGNIALGTAFGLWDEVAGSAAQLGVNIAGMLLAGVVTLTVQRTVWRHVRIPEGPGVRRQRRRLGLGPNRR